MEMERYRVTAGHDVGVRQRPAFYTNDAVRLPPKPAPLISRERCSFTAQVRPRASGDNHGRLLRLGEDSELSIFEAERYFNEADEEDDVGGGGGLEEGSRPPQRKDSAFGPADASPDTRDSCSLSSVDGGRRSRNGGSYYATPTASSEASWNSRSGLLTNTPGSLTVNVRAFPPNEQRKGNSNSSGSACRWLLRRSCPCSGKKAVKVQEKFSVPMSPSHSNFDSIATVSLKKKDSRAGDAYADQVVAALKELEMGSEWEMPKLKLVSGNWINEQDLFRDPSDQLHPSTVKHFPPEAAPCHQTVRAGKDDGGTVDAFSFPVLVQPITAAPGKPANSATTPPDVDPPRDSLEVFRPAEEAKLMSRNNPAVDLQRRAVTSTQMQMFPPRLDHGGPRRVVEDDLASDSSSDLFEIESFSTHATSCAGLYRPAPSSLPRLRRRSDELPAPSVAPSEGYAPSEASVQWSVATAEGGFGPGSVANFSSAASDCDNAGFTQLDHRAFSTAVLAASGGGGGGGRRRGGGLLSCRCEKAVSVGPSPVRTFGNERRRPSSHRRKGV